MGIRSGGCQGAAAGGGVVVGAGEINWPGSVVGVAVGFDSDSSALLLTTDGELVVGKILSGVGVSHGAEAWLPPNTKMAWWMVSWAVKTTASISATSCGPKMPRSKSAPAVPVTGDTETTTTKEASVIKPNNTTIKAVRRKSPRLNQRLLD